MIRLYVYFFGRMKDVGECEHFPVCVAVSLQYMSLLRTLVLICLTNSNRFTLTRTEWAAATKSAE